MGTYPLDAFAFSIGKRVIRWLQRWLFMRKVGRTELAAKPEYILSKAVHSWVTGLRRAGIPILHFHMKNEGRRDAPQTWVEKALGIMQTGWPDSTFIISQPYKPQLVIMVEIKVGKPGGDVAERKLSDNQRLFRDQTCKPMGIPHYAVSARNPAELIPQLVKILTYHAGVVGLNIDQIY